MPPIFEGGILGERDNERLLAENDPRGISNCLFLNAQNKQTVWDIVKPLRELGIPALAIVDIDILKDGKGCLLYTSPSPRD